MLSTNSLFLAVLFIVFASAVDGRKRVLFVINEFYLGGEVRWSSAGGNVPICSECEFIEIRQVFRPHRRPAGRNYRLIVVEKCPEQDPSLALMAIPSLKAGNVGDNKYWTIGARGVADDSDMTFDDSANVFAPGCPWKLGDPGGAAANIERCKSNILPDAQRCPIAIMLIKLDETGHHRSWSLPVRSDRIFNFAIRDGFEKLQQEPLTFGEEVVVGLEDLVIVYGDQTKEIDRTIFPCIEFLQQFALPTARNRAQILSVHGRSGFVYALPKPVYSMERMAASRCPPHSSHKSTFFAHTFFYLAPFTPGNPNDCLFEMHSLSYVQPQLEETDDDTATSGDESATTGDEIVTTGDEQDEHDLETEDPAFHVPPEIGDGRQLRYQRPLPEIVVQPRQYHRYSKREKDMIVHAVKFALIQDGQREDQATLTQSVIDKVQMITKCPRSTIFRIWRDENVCSTVQQCQVKAGRKKILINQGFAGQMRQRIHDFHNRREWPTMRKIHKSFEDEMNQNKFPQISMTTLWRAYRALGFGYVKRNDRQFVRENDYVLAMRAKYLRDIRKYRSLGYSIYYQDETWANAHHTHPRTWLDIQNKDSLLPETRAIGGFKVPSGLGRRKIINHAGGTGGFLPNIGDVFIGITGSGDYHSEMNSEHWLKWFEYTLLPALPHKSVIVVDNAKYHNSITRETRTPTTAWKKDEIASWINEKGIQLDHDIKHFKSELLQIAKSLHIEKKYVTDHLAESSGRNIIVLRLPIAHCELNPIELIWAQIKRKIADQNITFRIKDVFELAQAIIGDVTEEDWDKARQHVLKVEEQYWAHDQLTDTDEDQAIENIEDLDEGTFDINEENEEVAFDDLGLDP